MKKIRTNSYRNIADRMFGRQEKATEGIVYGTKSIIRKFIYNRYNKETCIRVNHQQGIDWS